jgi:hypothetical protein
LEELADRDQAERKSKRGSNIRKFSPSDLETVEGLQSVYSRLDGIFSQLGIADSGEAINSLVDGYNAYHDNLVKETLASKFASLRSQLGMSDDEFKAHMLNHFGIVNVTDAVEYEKPQTTPTKMSAKRPGKQVTGKSIE